MDFPEVPKHTPLLFPVCPSYTIYKKEDIVKKLSSILVLDKKQILNNSHSFQMKILQLKKVLQKTPKIHKAYDLHGNDDLNRWIIILFK
jgi:hypothetical protein